MNNAQVGSMSPLTLDEVVKEVNRMESIRENEARKVQKSSSIQSRLQGGSVTKELKQNFSQLVEAIAIPLLSI